ncbi:MAG: hypothetical protein HRU35_07220 [Rickettsiaceae bacterium]|nr:hypothetical protein [Rickettsiaceae bacterium]
MDNNYLPKDALQDNVNNILFWTLLEIDENAKNSKIHQQVTNIINKYDHVHSSGTYEAYYDKYCSGDDG